MHGFRVLRREPKTGTETSSENFATNCYGEIDRYKWRPLGFMKKMNEGLYRVSCFTRKNNLTIIASVVAN